MEKDKIVEYLQKLPKILVGSLAWDHKDTGIKLRDSCIEMIKEVIDISKPKEILEIGTHLGHSSCLFLCLSEAIVTSVDIAHTWVEWDFGYADWGVKGEKGGLKDVVATLATEFPDRFRFIKGSSVEVDTIFQFSDRQYGLAFIDGDHSYEFVKQDIKTVLKLGIPYILLDDFTGADAPCRIAAKELGLTFIKEYTNIHNQANISCGFFENPFI